jgi:hypothetical protein
MAQDETGNVVPMDKYRQQTEGHPTAVALKSGGGGGTFDPMERRVSALEEGFKRIEPKLDTVVKDTSEIKGRLSAMPTSWQLLGMILAIMGASFAIIRFGLGH